MPRRYRKKPMSRKVKKLEKQVQALVKAPERKHYDTVFNNSVTSGGIAVWPLLNLGQGTTKNQRIGADIKLKSLKFRLTITSADVYNDIRIMLVKMRYTTLPAADIVAEILADPTDSFHSFYNVSPDLKYSVLMDKRVQMAGRLGNHSGGAATSISATKKLDFEAPIGKNGVSQVFTPANAILPSCESYCIVALSDSGVTPYPQLIGKCRATFTDS